MSFLNGSVAITRFFIADGASITPEKFDERIRVGAFKSFHPVESDTNAGWVSIENILDTEFVGGHTFGNFRLFSMRIDRRKVPAAVLRVRCLEAEKRTLTETGQKRLYREQRNLIRESVRLELMKAMPPVPACIEVCWSVENGIVLLASVSEKVIDEFVVMFRESFGLSLQPAMLCSPPEELQRDFLTWLWFKSEERNGLIQGIDTTEYSITLFFVRRMILESGEGDFAEAIVCLGGEGGLKEAKEALRQGKRIAEARIRLVRDQAEWSFMIDNYPYQYRSMRIPVVMKDEEEDDLSFSGRVQERVYLIQRAIEAVDGLHAMFNGLRQSEKWSAELARMFKWASDNE